MQTMKLTLLILLLIIVEISLFILMAVYNNAFFFFGINIIGFFATSAYYSTRSNA